MFPTPAIGRWLSRYAFTGVRERARFAAKTSGVSAGSNGSGPSAASVGSPAYSPALTTRNRPKRRGSLKWRTSGPSPRRWRRTRTWSPGSSGEIEPVMPRWTTSSSPPSSGTRMNLPRRPTDSTRCPAARSSPTYFGPGGASSSARATSRPTSHGSSSRRTVSTSGSSGIGDLPFVEGASHDRALQAEAGVDVEVGVGADPAARVEGPAERVPDGGHRRGVDAPQRAVAGGVGEDHPPDAHRLHPAGEVGGVDVGGGLPAAHDDPAAGGVDRHDDALGTEALQGALDDLGLGHGHGAEHDGVRELEAPRRRLQAPDAASRLHAGLDAAAEALDLAQVLAVLEGGVEVDDVQAPGPERDEALSGLEGPRVVDGLALRVALVEPHGPAAPDVDAGDDLEHRQGD